MINSEAYEVIFFSVTLETRLFQCLETDTSVSKEPGESLELAGRLLTNMTSSHTLCF